MSLRLTPDGAYLDRMLTGFRHLALEVASLDRAEAFYVDRLGLDPIRRSETEVAFDVGEAELVLRRPDGLPRGGLHTHYAFATSPDGYGAWRERLADLDPEEFDFGSARSVYVFDPDDHCVEVGSFAEGDDPGLSRLFEVVLEVRDLDPAERAYAALGFEVVERGADRRRVRMRGPVDLELWEPQLGIADARGGVHVDVGFETPDPAAAADALGDHAREREPIEGGVRVYDEDGHALAFVGE